MGICADVILPLPLQANFTYRIPEGADERLRTALREASSGSVVPSLLEEIFCAG